MDIGAEELVNLLSEELKVMSVICNFSKLLADPSKPICSADLIRHIYKTNPSQPVSMNDEGYYLSSRVNSYWMEYHKILAEMMHFIQPKLVIGVHTHETNNKGPNVVFHTPSPQDTHIAEMLADKTK